MISIVTTLYKSDKYIESFYERALTTIRAVGINEYEFIFVNDGSPDKSLDVALSLRRKDGNVRVIDLSRNFGHHPAIFCGLSYVRGDHVLLIDVDLEEEPECLSLFWQTLKANPEADVVYGIQSSRKGGAFERITGQWFYQFFNLLCHTRIVPNQTTARLMTRRYVDVVCRYHEYEIMFDGVFEDAGFRQIPVSVTKHSSSPTSYTFAAKIKLAFNAITSFSDAPLRIIFLIGTLTTVTAFCYMVYIIIQALLLNRPVYGWASMMSAVVFFGGLTIFSIGLVGLYIGRIFMQVKNRPSPIVRKVFESELPPAGKL